MKNGPIAVLVLAVAVLLIAVGWMWNDSQQDDITIDVPGVHLR